MNQYRTQRGFTLMELMIATAIVAILGAIAIPMYSGYIKQSRLVEGQTELHAIEMAQEEYFADNSTYFEGGDAATLMANSGGFWAPGIKNEADREFAYTVTAGATGNIATSYIATATGKGNNVPVTEVMTIEH